MARVKLALADQTILARRWQASDTVTDAPSPSVLIMAGSDFPISNLPIQRGGRLETFGITNWRRQMYTTISGAFELWTRTQNNGVWSDWSKIL